MKSETKQERIINEMNEFWLKKEEWMKCNPAWRKNRMNDFRMKFDEWNLKRLNEIAAANN